MKQLGAKQTYEMESPGPERPWTPPCLKPQATSDFPVSEPITSLLGFSPRDRNFVTCSAQG